jgi:hypothetical protein
MREWQRIETAPHNEDAEIIVCDVEPNFYWVKVVRWQDWKQGWWDGEYGYRANDFTHWMPLPNPPETP